MIRRRYLLGFLILIGALAWWANDLFRAPVVQAPPPEEEARQIDYYFEDFRMISLDESGRRNHLLAGRRLEHYQDDGTSFVVEPHLEFVPLDAPDWTVESNSGWLSRDNSTIRLAGKVVMIRAGFANKPPLRIDTFDLLIDTETNFASTDKAVHLTSPGVDVTAIGMTTQFDRGLLSLLAEVKGTYVKTQP